MKLCTCYEETGSEIYFRTCSVLGKTKCKLLSMCGSQLTSCFFITLQWKLPFSLNTFSCCIWYAFTFKKLGQYYCRDNKSENVYDSLGYKIICTIYLA